MTNAKRTQHSRCKNCNSYAINHHLHGRDGTRGDLCDVCYWRDKAKAKRAPLSAAGVSSSRLLAAAVAWWKHKRPSHYSDKQHCDNPTVNTISKAEATLALCASQYVTAKSKTAGEQDQPLPAASAWRKSKPRDRQNEII